MQQYTEQDFGMLVKISETSKLPTINLEPLINFYTPLIVEDPNTQIELVREIRMRGFRRTSRNLDILAKLATNPHGYKKEVKSLLKEYEKSAYIGYRYTFDLREKTVHAIHTAVANMEQIFDKNHFSNPIVFIMSLIIAGFIYNYIPEEINYMRPVDYYDVVRFSLCLY